MLFKFLNSLYRFDVDVCASISKRQMPEVFQQG